MQTHVRWQNTQTEPKQILKVSYFFGAHPAPTDCSQLQGAGTQAGSPTHVFHPVSTPKAPLRLLWGTRRVKEADRQAAVTPNPNTQAWSRNMHARRAHARTHTHTVSSVPASLCRVGVVRAARQEIKCKKGVIVETAKWWSTQLSSWGGVHLKVESSRTRILNPFKDTGSVLLK